MDNPLYTEQRIDDALAGTGISVAWDGNEPTGDIVEWWPHEVRPAAALAR